jgi:hypothetical protein
MAQKTIFGYSKSNDFYKKKVSRVLRLNHGFANHGLYHENSITLTVYVNRAKALHALFCRAKYRLIITLSFIQKICLYILIVVKVVKRILTLCRTNPTVRPTLTRAVKRMLTLYGTTIQSILRSQE